MAFCQTARSLPENWRFKLPASSWLKMSFTKEASLDRTWGVLISVIFTWFLLSFYLLKLLVFLYFFWFDLIFIYIYLFICALKEWEDFRLIYKGFTCKVGLSELNQANLHPARHEFKRRPTQLNSSPIGARNQMKFAPNPSPIRIRIPAYTVSIFSITLGSDVQLRWFKFGWKFILKGYNFVVYQKPELWS